MRALDRQLATITGEVDDASQNVIATEDELADKRATLHARLVDIYKRGPLFTTEALLSAQSFGELVARYKYLHLLALHDRALVARVEQLRDQVARERDRLVQLQERARGEPRRQARGGRRPSRARARARVEVSRDEAQARQSPEPSLDRARGEPKRSSPTRSPPSRRSGGGARAARPTARAQREHDQDERLRQARLAGGRPARLHLRQGADGEQHDDSLERRRHPRARSARRCTPSRAGKVVSVGPLGTYGLTVIIDHGGGDYSIYGSLARADVRRHDTVTKGQVIGTVGISDPDLPPHLHFEIRHGGPVRRSGDLAARRALSFQLRAFPLS